MKRSKPTILIFLLVTCLTYLVSMPSPVFATISTVDSYSESNCNSNIGVRDNHPSDSVYYSAGGQSFTCSSSIMLDSACFYMDRVGSPTGSAYAKIYAHSGTYGSTSLPTGAALATSDGFDVSTLTESKVLYNISFSGENRIALSASTYYVVVMEAPSSGTINSSVYFNLGYDDSGSHSGNMVGYKDGGWVNWTSFDLCFYVYGEDDYPLYQSVGQSSSSIEYDQTNILYAQGYDFVGLHNSWLSTNETGSWQNYTQFWTVNETSDGMPYFEKVGYVANTTHRVSPASGCVVEDVVYLYYVNYDLQDVIMIKAPVPSTLDHDTFCWSNPITVINSSSYPAERLSVDYVNDVFYMMIVDILATETWLFNSTDGENWTYEATLTLNDVPSPWTDTLNRPELLYRDGEYMMWLTARNDTYADTLFFNSSTGYADLSYVGVALEHGVNSDLFGGASILEVWYNSTDSKYYGYVAGAHSGTVWYYVYGCNSSDGLNWGLSGLLLNYTTWDAGSWADAGIYAPEGVVIGNTFVGLISGYDDNATEEGHGHDLGYVIADSPMGLSNTDLMHGTYGIMGRPSSPNGLGDVADTWTWMNFTWANMSMSVGTTIAWKIYLNDTSGQLNVTSQMTFTITGPNDAPTNDACTITNMDDTNNIYAQRKWYLVSYDITDVQGFADINYAEVRFKQGGSTRAIFRYDEDTDTFSIQSGSSTWDCDTGGSSATESGTTINMTFHVKPQWDATEESSLEIECYVVDDYPESDTDTMQTNYCDVVTSIIVSGFQCDDDRGNTEQTIVFNGTLYYEDDPSSGSPSSSLIPDAEVTAIHIYNSTDNTLGNNSTSSGYFSVSFTAPSSVGTETFNCYIDGADGDFTDYEDTNTDSFISDNLQVYNIQTVEYLGAAQYGFEAQIKYGSDNADINGAFVNVSLPSGSVIGQLTSNSTGWISFVVDQTNASESGVYMIYGVDDNNYTVTVAGANQTFTLRSWILNSKDTDGNTLSSSTITVESGSTSVWSAGPDTIRIPESTFNISIVWQSITVNTTSNLVLSGDTTTNFTCLAYPYTYNAVRFWTASNSTIDSVSWSSNLLTVAFTGSVDTYILRATCTTIPVYVFNCSYDMSSDWSGALTLTHYGNTSIKIKYSNWGGAYLYYSDYRVNSVVWDGQEITIVTTGSSGDIGTLKFYCSSRGQPEEDTGFTSTSYSASTTLFTGSYAFSSDKTLTILWGASQGPSGVSSGPEWSAAVFRVMVDFAIPSTMEAGVTFTGTIDVSWTGTNIIYIYDIVFPVNQSWVSIVDELPFKMIKFTGEERGVGKISISITIPDSVPAGSYTIPIELHVINELEQLKVVVTSFEFEARGATYSVPEYMTLIFLGVIGLMVVGMVVREKKKH